MKRLLKAVVLGLCIAFATGCGGNNVIRNQNVDTDFEQLADDSIILSGGVDKDTYKEFLRATLTGKKHYTIRIMTNGGCAYNTVAIMGRIEMLQKQGVKFTMIVPGHAFSAGSYIFMMGDERIMYRGANLMWHTIIGQAKADSKRIPPFRMKILQDLDSFVVGKFMERFPHIKKVWVDETFWNSGMTWMNSVEAKLMGIATKIIN